MPVTRLYVGGIGPHVRERDIEKFFRGYGRLKDVLIKNGYCFVEFDDYKDAEDAIYELNGKDMLGQRVSVEAARGPSRRYEDFGGRYSARPQIGRSRYGPPLRTDHRIIVENLSSRVSWQDLKDYMRQAGEVTYADAHKNNKNEGVVEFASYRDMKYALERLDDTELSGRRVKLVDDSRGGRRSRSRSRRRSYSRSRSRSRSYSRSRSRSRSHRGKSRSRSRSRSKSDADRRASSKDGRHSRSRDGSHQRRDQDGAGDTDNHRPSNGSRERSRSGSPADNNGVAREKEVPTARDGVDGHKDGGADASSPSNNNGVDDQVSTTAVTSHNADNSNNNSGGEDDASLNRSDDRDRNEGSAGDHSDRVKCDEDNPDGDDNNSME